MEWTLMFESGTYHWRLVDARGAVITRSPNFLTKDAVMADATAARASLAALLGGPFVGLAGTIHAHALNEAAHAGIVNRVSGYFPA